MKFEMEVYKDVDFLSRLLTSNPYTAEGKSILNGLKINLTMADFFEQKIYAPPFFLNNEEHETHDEENVDEE